MKTDKQKLAEVQAKMFKGTVEQFIREWKKAKKGKACSGDCPDSVALMIYKERKKNGTSFSGMEKLFTFLADHNGMVAYRLFHRGRKIAQKKARAAAAK